MTTSLERLIHGLSTSARCWLLQIHADPGQMRHTPQSTLCKLFSEGVVNVVDGRAELSELGYQVIRYLANEPRAKLRERFGRVVADAIDDGDAGQVNIELTLSAEFTRDEIATLAPVIERFHNAMQTELALPE